jgi:hypothetical protein
VRRISGLVLALCLALSAAAAGVSDHGYPLRNHTGLILPVPDDWREEMKSAGADGPNSLYFTPQSGASFAVAVTPIVAMKDGSDIPAAQALRGLVSAEAQQLASKAVEKQLQIKDLVGPSCKGYYFRATDSAPAPGEWKYLIQGIVRVGGIDLGFDILTNDGQASVERTALEMIRHARVASPGQP